MIRQFIFIGVGGSGAKTLRATKAEIERTFSLTKEGRDYLKQFGFPKVWQFLSVDTPFFQDGQSFNAKMLPDSEYYGLTKANAQLDDLIMQIEKKTAFEREVQEEVMFALPKKGEYKKPVDQGAGQYRAIGRTVVLSKLEHLASEISQRINIMSNASGEEMPRLKKLFKGDGSGAEFSPQVVIISGLSGGSGSGQFLDVSEVLKSVRKGDQWAFDQSAILYAPDIFTSDTSFANRHGLAPNSMSALSELINAKHRKERSASLQRFYKQLGLSEANNAINNVGPKHIYLIGSSNGGDSVFLDQNEAFQAVGSALAKWATDPIISEDMRSYITNNIQDDSPPINSLGFSRVSLGMELFTKYSAGRLARYAITKLLTKHKDFNLKSEQLPDSVIVERAAKELFPEFSKSSPLRRSFIKELLHPSAEVDKWKLELKTDLLKDIGRSELPVEGWVDVISNNFKAAYPGGEVSWLRQRKKDQAVKAIQEEYVQQVLHYMAMYGLKITIKLLEMQVDQIRDNFSAPKGGGLPPASFTSDIMSKVKKALESVSGVVKSENQTIQEQFEFIASQSQENLSKFDDGEIATIIIDAGRNLVAPIASELIETEALLTEAKNNSDYKGRGVSKFLTWTDGDSEPVKPANNIKLLIPVDQYNELFSKLLCASVNEPQLSTALDKATNEMICGYKVIPELSKTNLEEVGISQEIWSVFGTRDNDSAQGTGTPWNPDSRTAWRYNLTEDLDFWEDIAEKYIRVRGRAFEKEISQSLFDWLKGDDSALTKSQRETRFLSAFTSALDSCKPFASPSKTLHIAAHNGLEPEIAPIFSKIPVDLSSTVSNLGQDLISAIKNRFPLVNPNQIGNKLFVGEDTVSFVDIFTTFTQPMDHYVLTNLMEPITTSWNTHNGSLDSKEKFLKWRSARPLLETIPLRPRDINAIIRGWYVARLLNLVTEVKGRTFVFNPKLSIFDVDRTREVNTYKDFPYPLAFRGTRVPQEDYLAAVLASVSVAFAECSNRGSLEPYRPYQILMEIGGREESGSDLPQSDQLYDWIFQNEDYKAQPDAPKPKESVAGPVSGSLADRAAYCVRFFQSELEAFKASVLPKHKYVIWQAREEVIKALETLIKMIEEISNS